jgi:hypothetical protein
MVTDSAGTVASADLSIDEAANGYAPDDRRVERVEPATLTLAR